MWSPTRRLEQSLFGFLLMGSLVFSACHQTDQQPSLQQRKQPVRLNIGVEPPTLDPIQMVDLTSFQVLQNLMRGLTQFDAQQAVIPALATHWELSADETEYTFHLRKDALWSDGSPITAQHIIDGWKRALTPANGSQYAFFLFDVVKAKAFYEGKLTDFSQVGIKALDTHTLHIKLNRPVAFFLSLMASPVAFPARLDLINRVGSQWTEAKHFIGNGPYRLARWDHDESITLKPNPHYWESTKQLPTVELAMITDANTSVVMYETGELDYITSPGSITSFDYRRLQDRPDAHRKTLNAIYYLGYNTEKPPFDDVRVRQAFALALDREQLTQLLQSGQQPLSGFITQGLKGFNRSVGLVLNTQRAKALLAEAGFPDGKGFPTVQLAFRTGFEQRREAEVLQFLWKQTLNVDVQLINQDWKVYLDQLATNTPHLYRLSWYVDYPDADSFMSLFTSTNGNNFTHWANPHYDQLIQQAAAKTDWALRQPLYDEAQKLLLEEATVVVPLYSRDKLWIQRPGRLDGLVVNGMNQLILDCLNNTKQRGSSSELSVAFQSTVESLSPVCQSAHSAQ